MTEGERETLDYTTLNMFAVYLGIQVLLFTSRVTHGQYLHIHTYTPLFLMNRSTTFFSSHREKTRRKKKDHVIRVTRENFFLFFSFFFFFKK